MPNGRIHNTSVLIASTATATAFVFSPELRTLVGATWPLLVVGQMSGIFLTPDLDLAENAVTTNEGLGSIIETVRKRPWKALWWPYGKVFRHRSFWSHAPGIGTLIRVAYACGITFGFFTLAPEIIRTQAFWIWMLGLALSDTLHWMLDQIF